MTGDDLSQLRQQLRRAHDAAGRILKLLLRDQPLPPGSFYLQKRRCGKPNCRCARGQLHTAWVITRSQDGATRTFMVPAQERARLRQLTWEYRRYHRARAVWSTGPWAESPPPTWMGTGSLDSTSNRRGAPAESVASMVAPVGIRVPDR